MLILVVRFNPITYSRKTYEDRTKDTLERKFNFVIFGNNYIL